MVLFSIITVCYNEENRIEKTLQSVCGQTCKNFEHIIEDGKSEDNTLDIVSKFEQSYEENQLKVFSEKDYGLYDAMNRAVKRAKGKYVFFLNAGDTFYDDKVLEHVSSYIVDQQTIYIGIINGINIDGTSDYTSFNCTEPGLKETLINGGGPCHQSIFAPVETLLSHEFQEDYSLAADLEWFDYCYSSGVKCTDIPVVISNYERFGLSGQSKNRRQYLCEVQKIIEKYFAIEDVYCIRQEQYLYWRLEAEKNICLLRTMNLWMKLKNRGIHIAEYFRMKGYNKVGIYGIGLLGQRLIEELVEDNINITALYDRNAQSISSNINCKVYLPEECKNIEQDIIVITAEFNFYDIRQYLIKYAICKMVSLEDILLDF